MHLQEHVESEGLGFTRKFQLVIGQTDLLRSFWDTSGRSSLQKDLIMS